MLIYWLMYLIPAFLAQLTSGHFKQSHPLPWVLIGIVFSFLIGFRFEVGGDWLNYVLHYHIAEASPFSQVMSYGDPGHQFLNWLMSRLGWGIYPIDLIYGATLTTGLIVFSRQLPKPWLAMTVAVPYLIIVVGMGYSRQSMAIGLFLLAIAALERGKFNQYILYLGIAALFHKTALLLIPLGVFLFGKGKVLRILMVIPIFYGLWDLLLSNAQEALWHNYVERARSSEGAKIRVMMNFFPSLVILLFWKQWKAQVPNHLFWLWIAIGSMISLALVGFAPAAVDRMALYFIAVQIAVMGRFPLLAGRWVSSHITTTAIVLLYALVLYVWLNYASHAHSWLPYKNILFQ